MKRIFSFTGVVAVFVGFVGMLLTLLEGRVTNEASWHFIVAGVLIAVYAASRFPMVVKALKTRQARLGAMVSVYTLIVFGLIVVINLIGGLTNAQVTDLTEKGLYSLSNQTGKVLESLDSDLYIHAFFARGNAGLRSYRDVDRLLRTFEAASPRIKLKVIDPEIDIAAAENFNIFKDATLVLEYKQQTRKVNTITEESLTNNIIRLLDDRDKKVCFTTGHGEPDVDGVGADRTNGMGRLSNLLEEKNYSVASIRLAASEDVPYECTVLAVAGPVTPFATGELIMLDNYLRLGGRLLVAQDAGVDTGIGILTERWGMMMNDDLVLEKVVEGSFMDGDFTPTGMKVSMALTVTDYNHSNPVVQDLSAKHPTNFNRARSLEKSGTFPNVNLRTMFESRNDSWSETDVQSALRGGTAVLNPKNGDKPGPLTLAMSMSYKTQSAGETLSGYTRQARMVVIGNAAWMQNLLLDETRNFNGDLAVNMIGWLAGMEEYLAIGSKSAKATSLFLNRSKKVILFNSTVLLLPEIFVMFGLAVWWFRR